MVRGWIFRNRDFFFKLNLHALWRGVHSALPLQLTLPVILQRLVSHICLICPAPEVSEFAPPVEDDTQALGFPSRGHRDLASCAILALQGRNSYILFWSLLTLLS